MDRKSAHGTKERVIKRKTRRTQTSFSFSRLLTSLTAFFLVLCYRQRKFLSIFLVASAVSISILASYKFVQAKIEEDSLFSDQDILRRAGAHFALPDEKPLLLVRVENPEKLRAENPFYKDVKEGDYIIAFSRVFIIYDAVHDEIEAVKESNKGKE